ncbi:patatin-like protein [Mycobacterium cookii]|uniref:PNPLA domain-containing protein n=1 Tax=Mycobacterium cookii TaxID=1775 RepID=A0A7I7KZM3_9MYCO|nr:patatin-like protein [Mycobacterium cookii]MCV7330555.1 patatin-like protein [Mycobacterium cookii]BBX47254.1 hypothetical protein MCOO_32690 [Mycobacterium cookii]
MNAPQPADSDDCSQPAVELRLAVAFTGGVSLAVWMGGMAREMNLLVAASRSRRERVADTSAQGGKVRELYADLLTLLNVDVGIDVISGTSAGGINAVILGLANVQGFDLDGLRELWFKEGALGTLLRDPSDKNPASLLYGDNVLLKGLREGLDALASRWPKNSAPEKDPTRVFITTTLLTGKASTFTDEYGTLISDTDHHGLFSFTSAQLTAKNVAALALAARCSASFPLAFEPGFIPIGTDGGNSHPNMADFAGIKSAQFAADGGLLANRPLGPALQAVFDRPANREVRRVLAFVVPTVSSGAQPSSPPTLADAPDLAGALAADVGAVLAQTISGDLTSIAAHNQRVRARSDARQQLALLGTQMQLLVPTKPRLGELFYRRYRECRAASIARAASDDVMTRMTTGQGAPDDRQVGLGTDADEALKAANAEAENVLASELPEVGRYDQMNAAGREALDEGRATVLALLTRTYQLLPSAEGKRALGRLRARVSDAMPQRAAPTREDAASDTVPGLDTLRTEAASAAAGLLGADMATTRQPWQDLATVVIDLRGLLPQRDASAPAPDSTPVSAGEYVWDVIDYLAGSPGDSADLVAARLFDLHVARYALQPDEVLADQALELVQMSSDTRTNLDPRKLAQEKLTGMALHHFGAFYKASWRANDWMWGRIDGAGWLVHLLLDPRRLRQLASESDDPTSFGKNLRLNLEQIAGGVAPPGIWERAKPAKAAEMEFLTDTTVTLPKSLPLTAMWVAAGIQRLIAGEELMHVVDQIARDKDDGADEDAAGDFVSAYHGAVGNAGGVVPETKVDEVLRACQIPAEKITSETDSRQFAQTVTRAAAVATKMVDLGNTTPVSLRPVLTTARTVTSLAYRVSTVGPAARRPFFAGLFLIALGVLASTSTIHVLDVAGLLAVLVGVLLVAVSNANRITLALAIVTTALGVALATAAYMPLLRDHLFPWLQNDVVPNLARHPAQWAMVVTFVLLPPIWTVVLIIETMIKKSRVRKTAAAGRAR